VAAIGWPVKPGDPAPLGRITVRIDDQGAASAELLATGPVTPSRQTTVAEGSAKLKADYGFASVRDDGTETWKDAEISDVAAALAILPAADRPALKGVELIRVKTIEGDNIAGEFSSGGGVTKGAIKITALPSLKLANLAFPPTPLKFYGGKENAVPASFQTILHEVGHAVEKETYRAANAAYAQALIEVNKKAAPLHQSSEAHKKASDEYAALYKKWKAAEKAGNAALKSSLGQQLLALDKTVEALAAKNQVQAPEYEKAETTRKIKQAAVDKTQVPTATLGSFKTDAAAKRTAASGALKAARVALKTMSADEVAGSAAYVRAVEAASGAIASFAKDAAADGSIEDLEKTTLAQTAARDGARDALVAVSPTHTALTTLAPVATAQDAWLEAERALAWARQRTLRVQKFVDLVTANHIEPFTAYAKKNWPHKPHEFYAEAYSLWLTDPEFLSTNYKVVYDFFQNGDYRK
jgi:hypothetical protein